MKVPSGDDWAVWLCAQNLMQRVLGLKKGDASSTQVKDHSDTTDVVRGQSLKLDNTEMKVLITQSGPLPPLRAGGDNRGSRINSMPISEQPPEATMAIAVTISGELSLRVRGILRSLHHLYSERKKSGTVFGPSRWGMRRPFHDDQAPRSFSGLPRQALRRATSVLSVQTSSKCARNRCPKHHRSV